MRALVFCGALAALCAPAQALPVLDITEMDNGDGSYTYWVSIDSLPEVSFLDLTISGNLKQVDGGATYDVISSAPWAPSVVFTSDQLLAGALNPTYAADQAEDTVINDDNWPGKVVVELDPPAGSGGSVAGTNSVHVALTSFTGGVGGPLPGGFIPLAHITTWGHSLYRVAGHLQSDSDTNGFFCWGIPEPSTAMLAAFGLMGLVAGLRHRK